MHDDMFALMRTHRMKIPAITDEVEVFFVVVWLNVSHSCEKDLRLQDGPKVTTVRSL